MDIKLIQEKIAEYKAKGCEVPEPETKCPSRK